MPYARLDDRYDDHRKVKRAWRLSPTAVALHAMAITYSNRHNTDGNIPCDWVEEKLDLSPIRSRDRQRVIDVLLETGLFEQNADGYTVHDYLEYNRSRAQRLALSEQGRSGGLAKARANAKPTLEPSPGGGSSHTDTDTEPTTEKDISSEASPSDPVDPADERLCKLLRDQATARNPKFKVKSRGRWLNDMRLLRELDGTSEADVERAIRFVFTDDFWGGVIQSPANLRKHFPRIWDRLAHVHNGVPAPRRESASDLLRAMWRPQEDQPVDADVVEESA